MKDQSIELDSSKEENPIDQNSVSSLGSDLHKENSEYKPDTLPMWINNNGEEVENVFGFNENAELVNGRVAMVAFLLLIITELIFHGEPAIKSIFGIG